MQSISANGEVSQAVFVLIRFLLTAAILIGQVLIIRWGVSTFLGSRGHRPARRRHWYAGIDVVIVGLLLVLHRPIQRLLTHIGERINHAFPEAELGWVGAAAAGMHSLLVATAILLIVQEVLIPRQDRV